MKCIKKSQKRRISYCWEDKIYHAICIAIISILLILVLYPLIHILAASFSNPKAVASGKVRLIPVDVSLEGFKAVLSYKPVFTGYRNTIFYTIVGTAINVFITLIAAYPFSRKGYPGKKFFTVIILVIPMMISGGMIPTYMLIKNLKMLNTIWAVLIPNAMGITNVIITRTFFQNTIPDELYDAAHVDGCSEFKCFTTIVLPLSTAIIAVISLFYAVGHWNEYFGSFLYLNEKKLYPLQLFLREILVLNQIDTNLTLDPEMAAAREGMSELLKYSLIVVSTAPILCVYPFVQKYFQKGVMVGSLKG